MLLPINNTLLHSKLASFPDSQRYFDYHHVGSDTFDAVKKQEFKMGGAAKEDMNHLIDKYGLEW
jgi:hypothetical protein